MQFCHFCPNLGSLSIRKSIILPIFKKTGNILKLHCARLSKAFVMIFRGNLSIYLQRIKLSRSFQEKRFRNGLDFGGSSPIIFWLLLFSIILRRPPDSIAKSIVKSAPRMMIEPFLPFGIKCNFCLKLL